MGINRRAGAVRDHGARLLRLPGASKACACARPRPPGPGGPL